jgi:hypothetical protein
LELTLSVTVQLNAKRENASGLTLSVMVQPNA